MRNLLIRTASGIVYVALMIAAVFTPWVSVPLTFFFGLVGIWELYKMYETPELKECYPFVNISAMTLLLAFLFASEMYAFLSSAPDIVGNIHFFSPGECVMLVLSMLGIFLPELICHHENPVLNIGMGLLSLIWILLPLSILFFVWIPQNPAQVLAFFILIWAADTFAYLGGSVFGKHKLAERISPGKTWEGFLISCLLTMALAIGISYIPYFQSTGFVLWQWIVMALLVEVFGLMGDLVESLFKRKAGVKDSGNIIPGHGGVLDRIDSILFATIPVFLFCLACC